MRLQLKTGAILALALVTIPARAEDRVTVRGAYYREPSTKVVQPMLEVSKDLPYGFDVNAHGLVDAITSPSVLTGVMGDNIFTEHRKEAGVGVGKTIDRTHLGLFYRQSREPDYVAHAVGLQVSQGIWENTGTVAFNLAYSHDTIGPFLNHTLQVVFGGISYEQALSPLLLGQVGYELSLLDGYLCNPYDTNPRTGRAVCPDQRVRHVVVLRVARYFPSAAAGVQLHYRFYYDQWWNPKPDPWGLTAHSVEGRLYQEIGQHLELRLSYRYHTQGWARFAFCGSNPARVDPECGPDITAFHTGDEKFGPLHTHLAELKLTWEARALASVPVLAWFALGAFEISYGRYFQSTHYHDAHLLQTGYSLPF